MSWVKFVIEPRWRATITKADRFGYDIVFTQIPVAGWVALEQETRPWRPTRRSAQRCATRRLRRLNRARETWEA